MFGKKRMNESSDSPDEYDLRKQIYMKISKSGNVNIDQLVKEIETEYVHKEEIEKKLSFLVTEGFVKRETIEDISYYSAIE